MLYMKNCTTQKRRMRPAKASRTALFLLGLCLVVLPMVGNAAAIGSELHIGILSTLTAEMYPLEPQERDIINIYSIMYEGLIEIDDNYMPQPKLCEALPEVSSNGKTWTFQLREEVFFSDGTPLTAHDVVATVEYILNRAETGGAGNRGYYGNLRFFVDSVKADGDSTVVFKSKRPNYGFLYAMTFPILPADKVYQANPPGTGPYVVETFWPGEAIFLGTNPYWWKVRPQVANIYATLYTNDRQLMAAYESNEIGTAFSRSVAASQIRSSTSAVSLTYRTQQLEVLQMNHSEYPLGNVNIRKAIRYAIDIDKIAGQVYSDVVRRTDTPMPAGTWMHYADSATAYSYDPDKARQILAEEGWADTDDDGVLDKVEDDKPRRLRLRLYVYDEPGNTLRSEVGQRIADMLTAVGFSIDLRVEPFSEVANKLSKGSFDLALIGYQIDTVPDPGYLLLSGNDGNYGRYKNAAMNDLCNDLRKMVNYDSYKSKLMDIQALYLEDLPFICMYYRSGMALTRTMYTDVRDIRELELLRGVESIKTR